MGYDSDGEETITQCCQVPRARRKQLRDHSTIIEFVPVPVENINETPPSSPVLPRKYQDPVKDISWTSPAKQYYNPSSFYPDHGQLFPSSLLCNNGQIVPMYHENYGASYIDIPQPSNVVIQRNSNFMMLQESTFRESQQKFDDRSTNNDSLLHYRNASSLSSHSQSSHPSDSISTMNSGYKFKNHLWIRYSTELEEENRMLKEMLRKISLTLCLKITLT